MCKRTDKRVSCYSCGYPGSESRYNLSSVDWIPCKTEEAALIHVAAMCNIIDTGEWPVDTIEERVAFVKRWLDLIIFKQEKEDV